MCYSSCSAVFSIHAYPDRIALLQLISNVTLLSHSRLHSVGRCVLSMTPWPWLDPAFRNFLCDSEKWWWVDSDTESLRQFGIAFPECLCERKSHGYWVHSISKLHVPKQQATPQATRQGISEHSWPSMIRARLIRSSPAISKSNRFPVVLPCYLIATRLFQNPTARSLFPLILLWDLLSDRRVILCAL